MQDHGFLMGQTKIFQGLSLARWPCIENLCYKLIISLSSFIPSETKPCELHCRAQGQTFFAKLADKVIDGTPCRNNSDIDVCVDGMCKVSLYRFACILDSSLYSCKLEGLFPPLNKVQQSRCMIPSWLKAISVKICPTPEIPS